MTADGASLAAPVRPAAETFADDPDEIFVGDRRRRRWAWVACVVVLILATAATVGLLLMQWMATGSGTVAR